MQRKSVDKDINQISQNSKIEKLLISKNFCEIRNLRQSEMAATTMLSKGQLRELNFVVEISLQICKNMPSNCSFSSAANIF